MMQVLEYSRVVHSTNRTWMYVAYAAEYYYYTIHYYTSKRIL